MSGCWSIIYILSSGETPSYLFMPKSNSDSRPEKSKPNERDVWGNLWHGFTSDQNLGELKSENKDLEREIGHLKQENAKLHKKLERDEAELQKAQREIFERNKKDSADKNTKFRKIMSVYENEVIEFNRLEELYLHQQLQPAKKGLFISDKPQQSLINRPTFPNIHKLLDKVDANWLVHSREHGSAPVTHNTTTVHHHGGGSPLKDFDGVMIGGKAVNSIAGFTSEIIKEKMKQALPSFRQKATDK